MVATAGGAVEGAGGFSVPGAVDGAGGVTVTGAAVPEAVDGAGGAAVAGAAFGTALLEEEEDMADLVNNKVDADSFKF